MRCVHCDSRLESGARFCSGCSAPTDIERAYKVIKSKPTISEVYKPKIKSLEKPKTITHKEKSDDGENVPMTIALLIGVSGVVIMLFMMFLQ